MIDNYHLYLRYTYRLKRLLSYFRPFIGYSVFYLEKKK